VPTQRGTAIRSVAGALALRFSGNRIRRFDRRCDCSLCTWCACLTSSIIDKREPKKGTKGPGTSFVLGEPRKVPPRYACVPSLLERDQPFPKLTFRLRRKLWRPRHEPTRERARPARREGRLGRTVSDCESSVRRNGSEGIFVFFERVAVLGKPVFPDKESSRCWILEQIRVRPGEADYVSAPRIHLG
jgi:hypothetical protein